MPVDRHSQHHNIIETGVKDIRLENRQVSKERGRTRPDDLKERSPSTSTFLPRDIIMESISQSPMKNGHDSEASTPTNEKRQEIVGGDITLKMEPGQPPKLSRSTSQKIVARSPVSYNDYPDKTEEAQRYFEMLPACSYANKYIGASQHQYMDCECVEEWGKACTPLSIYIYVYHEISY